MRPHRLPVFIARSRYSSDDFLDSDFSYSPCWVHCQFVADEIDMMVLAKLSQRGVQRIDFLGGRRFKRSNEGWRDVDGKLVELKYSVGVDRLIAQSECSGL